MDDNTEIEYFFDKCDEYMRSSFILARPRLVELLKSITASRILTEAFTAVVSGFDYAKAKSRCMVTVGPKENPKHKLLLPRDPSDKLAFIFLLLCDFEKETIQFNQFLFTYFDRDGNYSAGFSAFCAEVIAPFKNIIYEAFYGDPETLKADAIAAVQEEEAAKKSAASKKEAEKEERTEKAEGAPSPKKAEPDEKIVVEEPFKEKAPAESVSKKAADSVREPVFTRPAFSDGAFTVTETPASTEAKAVNAVNMAAYKLLSCFTKKRSGLFSRKIKRLAESISPLIARERAELSVTELEPEEKSVGMIILSEAEACLSDSDIEGLKTALCGYYYYISYNGFVSSNILGAYEILEDFEKSDK